MTSMTAHDRSDAKEPATRFVLWIDGVGGFLLCLSHRVTLGRVNPDAPVDIALLADVSRHHASIQRDTEGYFLEAVRKTQVNGEQRERAFLHSSDRITLGPSCQLQFWQPTPVSTSARLDMVSGHRFVQPVQAALLMSDTLVLGPGHSGHVCVPDMTQQLIIYRTRAGLYVRWPGPIQVDGRGMSDRAPLEPGTTVTTEQISLALEAVEAPS